MRLSPESIKCLQILLKDLYGLDCTDVEAQEAGTAIMRFVIAKHQRHQQLTMEIKEL